MSSPNDVIIRLGADDSGLPPPIQRTNAAIASIGTTAEVSARQTANAMRQLPAQFTDVATQLAGGQNPLLVLLQQGGQIKDSFGGIGPAISGIGAAINPVTLGIGALAAAVGAFGLAAFKGAEQDEALRDSMALTGNAAGLTASRLQLLAATVADGSQQTVGASRDIVAALASSGQVSGTVLASMAQAVARVADVSGEDSKKVAADFAGMASGVAKWAAEHNRAWNFISVEQYKYIRGLEEQGQAEKAMIYTSGLVNARLDEQRKNLGILESAWGGVRKAAGATWDAMLGVGKEQNTREKLDAAITRLQGLRTGTERDPVKIERAEQRIQFLKEELKLQGQAADAASRNAATNRAEIAEERKNEGKSQGNAAEFKFSAIRSAQEQYHQDFLRSEKGFYADLDKQRQAELEAGRKDPLGDFITQKALPEAQARDEKRLAQNETYLQALLDANERAAAEQITDERARGEALIRLDREQALRRLKLRNLEGEDLGTATGAIEQQTLLRRKQLDTELAQSAGSQTYQNIYAAAAAALQDTSGNPVTTFAQTLGRAVFQQITNNAAQALALAAVGKSGQGSLFGDLINAFTSFKYSGSSTDVSAPNYENQFDLMNAPAMATGTNYLPRNMMVMAHEGEAIVPKKYNPAAGGWGGRGGSAPQISQVFHIDARTDQAQVAEIAYTASAQGVQAAMERLRDAGVMA